MLPRAIGLFLVALALGLVVGLFVAVLAIVAFAAGPAGILLAALAFLVAFPFAIYLSARLSLLLPVLVLEPTPVLAVIGRTWRLTRSHALALFLTAFVIGLSGLVPAWGSALFSLFVDNRVMAGVAVALATMVVAPLGPSGRSSPGAASPARRTAIRRSWPPARAPHRVRARGGRRDGPRRHRRRARGNGLGGVPPAHRELTTGACHGAPRPEARVL